MKAVDSSRTLQSSHEFKTMQFGIKSKNLGHIIGLLRDEIYSDKILAVIREYSCNAMDANVMSGRKNEPIVVTLPTRLSPEFRVRDYGDGLSEQEIEDIFISYGESTKRNTNDAIGFLGIGAKAGFAYNDNFLVVSYYDGMKTTYNCALDASNVGNCIVFSKERMSDSDKTGVEIIIPAKMGDCNHFLSAAKDFFKYWNMQPIFVNYADDFKNNTIENLLFSAKDGSWQILNANRHSYYNSAPSIAVMGGIPYPIDWNAFRPETAPEGLDLIKQCKCVMKFNIGELQFAPSREALQYTNATNASIARMVEKIAKELKDIVHQTFKDCKSLTQAMSLYGESFENYSSVFYGHKSYSIGLQWNNIPITTSFLDFSKVDSELGYNANGFGFNELNKLTGGKRTEYLHINNVYDHSSSGIVKKVRRSQHVGVKGGLMFVDVDIEKGVYERKAVAYLFDKHTDINKVVVLRFDKDKARTDTYTHFHLKCFDVVKYSDIKDQVKKTIVRVGRAGVGASNGGTSYVRRVRYISADSHYYNDKLEMSDDVDLSTATGYYFEMIDANPRFNNNFISVRDMSAKVRNLTTLALEVLKIKIPSVYGFGLQICTSSKLEKILKKNWVKIEDLEKNIHVALATSVKFKQWSAMHTALNKFDIENCDEFFELVKDLAKEVESKSNTIKDLKDSLVNYDIPTTARKDRLYEVIGSVCQNEKFVHLYKTEYDHIHSAMKLFMESYPMIRRYVVDKYNRWGSESHDMQMLANYVLLCDKHIKKTK